MNNARSKYLSNLRINPELYIRSNLEDVYIAGSTYCIGRLNGMYLLWYGGVGHFAAVKRLGVWVDE